MAINFKSRPVCLLARVMMLSVLIL